MGSFYLRKVPGLDAQDRAEELLLRATHLKTYHPEQVYLDLGDLYVRDREADNLLRAFSAEHVASKTAPLQVGDVVIVCQLSDAPDSAVIIGRLARVGDEDLGRETAADNELPDSLVLEAKQSLTLRVGDGSITIRADGKILIKGKDLVSHAKNVNRIKGGAVAIN